ncbi:tRNA pseudouridine(55) synthase TruB [Mycoplasma sp. 'Moose RK']|uniref:tRNA pseudouridine(55) synthase TruB n=1 Tax=Mycoplasma sp. 'Moose RK' TaxID=2780095 RepID=UPI0018C26A6C|nr:tRNA pseudouridine(55) synthase TruB [Mycoplasma sp. 'Moose RK']MBG0730778.1 tRNA pseudouridine(55) synthase TruB [Mycoplasma sp. 'Moose RK']
MIILLYKPKNVSSATFIRNWARENFHKKAGHAGTLDPLASGLLLVATDEDTKLLSYLDADFKTYLAKVQFGFYSDSFDAGSEIFAVKNPKIIEKKDLLTALENLANQRSQIPPIFSAKKLAGKPAYKFARENKTVYLKPINIEINHWELANFDVKSQLATIKWHVSRGTYIRTLADDLGKMLENRAYLKELERVKIGKFDLDSCNFPLDAKNLLNYDSVSLTFAQLQLLSQGKKVDFFAKNNDFIALVFQDDVIGFGKIDQNKLISKRLFGKKIAKFLKKLE